LATSVMVTAPRRTLAQAESITSGLALRV